MVYKYDAFFGFISCIHIFCIKKTDWLWNLLKLEYQVKTLCSGVEKIPKKAN